MEKDTLVAEDYGQGRRLWKILTGYHLRSLGEISMYRFKTLLGNTLVCRTESNQKAEVYVKCLVINTMNSLGMPIGGWTA